MPLPATAAARLDEIVDALAAMGFDVEPFGADALLARSVPEALQHLDVADALGDAISLSEVGRSSVDEALGTRLALHVCKRAAVKAGQALDMEEMRALVSRLRGTESPRTCPHGRPTVIVLSAQRIWREFGRV